MKTIQQFNEALTSNGRKLISGNKNHLTLFIDDEDTKTGFIYELEVFPKRIYLKTTRRVDWDEEKQRFDTLLPTGKVEIDNKRGLKAVLTTAEKIRKKFQYDHWNMADPRCMSIAYWGQDI